MKVTIPKNRHPDFALTFANGTWRASYKRGHRRLYKSLDAPDRETARLRRDEFFEHLRVSEGATECGPKPVNPDSDAGVYPQKPWVVKIRGVWIGEFSTIEEARAAKRAYLLNLKNTTP